MNFSQLMGLAGGHVEARIVQTAVELAIFDALEATDLDAPTLAQNLQLDEQATELLLNALTAVGLLAKHRTDFSLTEVSRRHLLRSSPHYVGGMIGFDAMLWHDWEKLPEAIRTGLPTRPPNMYQSDARGNRGLHQRHGLFGQSARRRGSLGRVSLTGPRSSRFSTSAPDPPPIRSPYAKNFPIYAQPSSICRER